VSNCVTNQVFYRIQKRCHAVFFKQIGVWIIHGELVEKDQFFITKDARDDASHDVEVVQVTLSN